MPPNNEQSLQNSTDYLTGTLKSPWVTGDCSSEDPQTPPAQRRTIRNKRHVLFCPVLSPMTSQFVKLESFNALNYVSWPKIWGLLFNLNPTCLVNSKKSPYLCQIIPVKTTRYLLKRNIHICGFDAYFTISIGHFFLYIFIRVPFANV